MTTQTLTLADFLLARIAEREDTARRALEEAPRLEWACEPVYDGVYSVDLGPATHPDTDSYGVGEDIRIPREMARHIEANSPARVLAECEAKRRIVSRCDLVLRGRGVGMFNEGQVTDARDNLRSLALPYADHPDYRDEWRP